MKRIHVDRFTLGDIAEESGQKIEVSPAPYGDLVHIVASVKVLVGTSGQLEFFSMIRRPAVGPIAPPTVESLRGKQL